MTATVLTLQRARSAAEHHRAEVRGDTALCAGLPAENGGNCRRQDDVNNRKIDSRAHCAIDVTDRLDSDGLHLAAGMEESLLAVRAEAQAKAHLLGADDVLHPQQDIARRLGGCTEGRRRSYHRAGVDHA